jgi:hypothetical protein
MKRYLKVLPLLTASIIGLAFLLHGPIMQLEGYHHFADQSTLLGIPRGADVLSNLVFALVGVLGWICLYPVRNHVAIKRGWAGYQLFLIGLTLTAVGSGYYHLAPDNARLVWDRLPIALACAGLLAAVRGETVPGANQLLDTVLLALAACASVAWWYFSDLHGHGDLRPYLLLQVLPLVLIPLWQALHGAPRRDRAWFGLGLLLYVIAKIAELHDHQILTATAWVSGHTLKHALAGAAAGVIVVRLAARVRDDAGGLREGVAP